MQYNYRVVAATLMIRMWKKVRKHTHTYAHNISHTRNFIYNKILFVPPTYASLFLGFRSSFIIYVETVKYSDSQETVSVVHVRTHQCVISKFTAHLRSDNSIVLRLIVIFVVVAAVEFLRRSLLSLLCACVCVCVNFRCRVLLLQVQLLCMW